MLLRRIYEHVRAQHWTAICIDFVIVVVGVFIGTQVSNWNTTRIDRERAQGFLERIAADLDADLSTYEDRGRFWAKVREYGTQALHYEETGDAQGASHWQVLLAFFQSSQVAEFFTTSATFEELKSAGDLGLIADVDLRNTLGQYYASGDNPALRERPRYREHVRGLIPLEIQSYIWTHCYASDIHMRQSFVDCPSPIAEASAAEIVERFRREASLIEELRYWMSTMQVATIIAHDRAASAKLMRDQLHAALGAPAPAALKAGS
jgi:hypothetical protein